MTPDRISESVYLKQPMNAYQQSVDDVLTALETGRRGLTEEQARARLSRYGPNELTAKKPVPAWRKLLAQFQVDAAVVPGISSASSHVLDAEPLS